MKKTIVLLFFTVFLFAKNILVINSYSVRLKWTREEMKGILNRLEGKKNIKLYIDFMDTKQFAPTPSRMAAFYDYLNSKYQNIPIDIIIVTDDNALNFVRKYKDMPLFRNAKIFFAGINNLNNVHILNKNIYTGVFEKKEPHCNLKFLDKVVPDLKYVYVVSDHSNSGTSVINEYRASFKNIKKYKFIYINNANLDYVIDKIKKAKNSSGMLLLTPFSFYLKGNHINYKYAIALLSAFFPHPMVIHTDLLANMKNSNIIGGRVTDGVTQGEVTAQKVLQYLQGKKIKNIPYTFEKANKMYLNVKNLEKFGINAYSLGYNGAIYVNKPDTFYYKYRNWIISFFIIFILVIIIAVILFIKNRQLVKYNDKIEKLNETLESKMETVIEKLKTEKKDDKNIKQIDRFLKNFIFQMKYPIEKLKDNSEEALYLKNKIREIEKMVSNEKKEHFSVRNEIIALAQKADVVFEIEGGDFELFTYRQTFDEIFISIFKLIKTLENIRINAVIKENKISLIVKSRDMSGNIIKYGDIFSEIYLFDMFLKYRLGGNTDMKRVKNTLIYEIILH